MAGANIAAIPSHKEVEITGWLAFLFRDARSSMGSSFQNSMITTVQQSLQFMSSFSSNPPREPYFHRLTTE